MSLFRLHCSNYQTQRASSRKEVVEHLANKQNPELERHTQECLSPTHPLFPCPPLTFSPVPLCCPHRPL